MIVLRSFTLDFFKDIFHTSSTFLLCAKKMSECIYKFVEQPQPKKPKKQIYRSKYDPNGPLIGSTFCMHGTTAVDGKGFHSLKKVRSSSWFDPFFATFLTHVLLPTILPMPEPRREHSVWSPATATQSKTIPSKGNAAMQRRR